MKQGNMKDYLNKATYPLDTIQMDHMVLDILTVDEVSEEVGRPSLTVPSDALSRTVLGMDKSFMSSPNE